jgi:D-sedoheptulose 7-phosphate isomerase
MEEKLGPGPPYSDRWTAELREHLNGTAALLTVIAAECGGSVETAVKLMAGSIRHGGKLMICGNGGSAADSQHIAAELTSRLTSDFVRPGIAAIALTTDTSFLTAYANDYGYAGVFQRQLEALGRRGDVLLGISTSGGSENVRLAVLAARRLGIISIALVGEGGLLATEADAAIVIPSRDTAHVQEGMLAVEHVLCHALERELFPD